MVYIGLFQVCLAIGILDWKTNLQLFCLSSLFDSGIVMIHVSISLNLQIFFIK